MRKLPLFVLAALLATPASATVMIDWVAVGNPGNAADDALNCWWAANCGSVSYNYYIGKYEVTNAQYAELLNAKAASDPLGLVSHSVVHPGPFGRMGLLTPTTHPKESPDETPS